MILGSYVSTVSPVLIEQLLYFLKHQGKYPTSTFLLYPGSLHPSAGWMTPPQSYNKHGRQQVSFFSDAFPRCEEDDKKLNPQRWGYKAAEYLREQLENHGLPARGPYAERWGWALRVMHGKDMFMVGCGIAGDETNLFLVIIDPIRPFLSLFGQKPDPTPVGAAVDEILRNEELFKEVEWEPAN